MKGKDIGLCVGIVLLFCFQLFFPMASAHDGENFTIIITENGSIPGKPTILVNDTALWINVDERENITHQIMVDANSDGIYDSEDDWISENLTFQKNCLNENQTRKENCEASFSVTFNETAMNMSYYDVVGTYAFIDIASTGSKFYGNITIIPDIHLTAGFQETPVTEEKDDDEKPAFLLIIAAVSGIGAVILGAMIIFGNKDE